ncbi:hypothetical protein BC826DRAFT_1035409 [Russula brevipes]|nr:hypothetical protein BC826DRAFT_1035409 [Russula brevipes]
MVGTSSPIYHREEFIPIQGIFITCHACFAGALWGKNDGRVTRARKYFLKGILAIGTCQGSGCSVCHCTAALWSPCGCESAGTGVNVQRILTRVLCVEPLIVMETRLAAIPPPINVVQADIPRGCVALTALYPIDGQVLVYTLLSRGVWHQVYIRTTFPKKRALKCPWLEKRRIGKRCEHQYSDDPCQPTSELGQAIRDYS